MSDPTGTYALRRSFQAEANRRLALVRSLTHTVLVEHDVMAARDDPLAALFPVPGHRLASFMYWFEATVNAQLLGTLWWEPFLERAYESGAVAGSELVRSPPRTSLVPVPAVYRELAEGEFAGIAAALVQQVRRQTGMAALTARKPLPIYQQVLMVLRKVGQARMQMAVNTMTVQLHNAARLLQFRAAGVTHVGVVPERLELARPSRFLRKHDHAHHMHDASREERARAAAEKRARELFARQLGEAEKEAALAQVAAERARATLERQIGATLAAAVLGEEIITPSKAEALAELQAAQVEAAAEIEAAKAATVAREVEAAAAWEAVKQARREEALSSQRRPPEIHPPSAERVVPPGYERVAEITVGKPEIPARLLKIGAEFVNVQTAGDDRVCQICQDISDEGPYSLAEAQGLIPAHVNCRCAFVPFDDMRFKVNRVLAGEEEVVTAE